VAVPVLGAVVVGAVAVAGVVVVVVVVAAAAAALVVVLALVGGLELVVVAAACGEGGSAGVAVVVEATEAAAVGPVGLNTPLSGGWMLAAALSGSDWPAPRKYSDVGPGMTIPMRVARRSIRCASDSEDTLARSRSLRL
jgi:hypothetical protein